MPGCPDAHALEANDLAAVKLAVGPPKDLSLVRMLHDSGRISAGTVRERIDALTTAVELKPRLAGEAIEPRAQVVGGLRSVKVEEIH